MRVHKLTIDFHGMLSIVNCFYDDHNAPSLVSFVISIVIDIGMVRKDVMIVSCK
jgi:hypothetical protein